MMVAQVKVVALEVVRSQVWMYCVYETRRIIPPNICWAPRTSMCSCTGATLHNSHVNSAL